MIFGAASRALCCPRNRRITIGEFPARHPGLSNLAVHHHEQGDTAMYSIVQHEEDSRFSLHSKIAPSIAGPFDAAVSVAEPCSLLLPRRSVAGASQNSRLALFRKVFTFLTVSAAGSSDRPSSGRASSSTGSSSTGSSSGRSSAGSSAGRSGSAHVNPTSQDTHSPSTSVGTSPPLPPISSEGQSGTPSSAEPSASTSAPGRPSLRRQQGFYNHVTSLAGSSTSESSAGPSTHSSSLNAESGSPSVSPNEAPQSMSSSSQSSSYPSSSQRPSATNPSLSHPEVGPSPTPVLPSSLASRPPLSPAIGGRSTSTASQPRSIPGPARPLSRYGEPSELTPQPPVTGPTNMAEYIARHNQQSEASSRRLAGRFHLRQARSTLRRRNPQVAERLDYSDEIEENGRRYPMRARGPRHEHRNPPPSRLHVVATPDDEAPIGDGDASNTNHTSDRSDAADVNNVLNQLGVLPVADDHT